MATVDELSDCLRIHVFRSTKKQVPIVIKEGSEKASNSGTESRRKQGAEFWADFREAAIAVSGDEEITTQTLVLEELEERYKALLAETDHLKRKVKARSSEVYFDSRIHELQEESERAWEAQMEAGKKTLERLEVQLAAVQQEVDALDSALLQAHAPDRATILGYNLELGKVLQLRVEEKKDVLAALDNSKRKLTDRRNSQSLVATEVPSERLQELKAKRSRLRESIISLTPSGANRDAEANEEGAIALSKRLKQAQETLSAREAKAARIKSQMRKLVQVQASDRNVAAVLLQLLFDHGGEWTKKELQSEVATQAQVDESIVIRALYSLVASGLVHLDRSSAQGLVTSLLI
ncbi:hypothetical protein H310_08097 [Aphanomyces invadans]|uniref:Uncharacterized protein n=1 Tax=Aphanomyces invadans TaxID=157072 RepID=A0A024TZ34_9STRA|nr:hypothetical protein H310_08097 [Aphanomyces invadans]ETV99390.1 hypothetical protein H310_08097 [Aphanomyces invadans]|eukprot:XP_008871946.1 hypothetical protein H310_08097 [Aphanomyces invadans]